MLNLVNRSDISGMFSKIGRISYERYPILHKKEDILFGGEKPTISKPQSSAIDDIQGNFGNKLNVLRDKAANRTSAMENEERELEGDEEEEEDGEPRADFMKRNKQPMGLVKSRFDGKDANTNPAPGFYNPRYEVILPRVHSSVIKRKFRKNKKIMKFQHEQDRMQEERAMLISAKMKNSRIGANRSRMLNMSMESKQISDKNQSDVEKNETQHVDENGEPVAYDEDNENVNDNSYSKIMSDYGESCFEDSAIIAQARGYYQMRKMTGRNNAPQGNYMTDQPNPHESRFDSAVNQSTKLPKLKNIIPLSKITGRDSEKRLKEFAACPNYNPNFDYTMKKVSSMPTFGKLLGRKEHKKPIYCLNDFRDYNKVFEQEKKGELRKSPNFSYMLGRQIRTKKHK